MKKIGDDIWVADAPLKLLGCEFGARMTVIKYGDKKLLLHSPIKPTTQILEKLAALGDITSVVAPNQFHHLYAKYYRKFSNHARYYGVSSLKKKRPDIQFDVFLDGLPRHEWGDDIDYHLLTGTRLQEAVFFHKPSKTLLLTDLMFHLKPKGLSEMALHGLMGLKKHPAPSRIFRQTMVRNKKQFKQSIEHILAWDFDRISLCHGSIVETDGKARLREAFHWLF